MQQVTIFLLLIVGGGSYDLQVTFEDDSSLNEQLSKSKMGEAVAGPEEVWLQSSCPAHLQQ